MGGNKIVVDIPVITIQDPFISFDIPMPYHEGIYKVVDSRGIVCWCKDGKIHRDDGPAIFFIGGVTQWFHEGKRHRADGPSWLDAAGRPLGWFVNGEEMFHSADYQKATGATDEFMAFLRLKFGEFYLS